MLIQSKPGKARSEGSSSRRGGSCRRTAANDAPAAADGNVKRSSILLRALSSSTLAQLTRPSVTPDPTPRSRCKTVCEGDPSCELDAPVGAPEDAGPRAPPNSPAVLPRGVLFLDRHTSRSPCCPVISRCCCFAPLWAILNPILWHARGMPWHEEGKAAKQTATQCICLFLLLVEQRRALRFDRWMFLAQKEVKLKG